MIRKCTTLFFLFLFSTMLFSQTAVNVSLTPYGVTPFMVAASTTDMYDYTFNGLRNVGVGTKVYLEVAVTGKKIGTLAFSWIRKPVGATAAINATKDVKNDSTHIVFFTADLPGAYELKVTDGVYFATVVINAAKYLGYTNTMVNGVDTKVNCKTCHATYVANWEKTNHASLFTKAMKATPGISGPADHYSANCIKCHTTGYDVNPTAKNDGFDDLGFVYPTTITSTTYNTLLTQFPEAMKRGDIQCESCHGPASGHLGVTSDQRINVTYDPDVCAWCHESGTNHTVARQFRTALHAKPVDESGSGREGCVRCHTGKGFAQFSNGVKSTDPYFDVTFYPISCAGCHDPHNAKNPKQLRMADAFDAPTGLIKIASADNLGKGAVCVNCHQSRTDPVAALTPTVPSISFRFGPHYGAQGDMFVGRNMLEIGGVKLSKSLHMEYTKALDGCVACHMYNADILDNSKNLIEWGGHTFNMSTFKKDANGNYLKDSHGSNIPDKDHVTACAPCHGGTIVSFDTVPFIMFGSGDHDNDGVVKGLQAEVWGMINKVMAELAKIPGTTMQTEYGQYDAAGKFLPFPVPKNTWTKTQLSAYWNAITAHNDKSGGIHNPKYIVSGLKGAMAAVGLKTAVKQDESIPTEYALFQNYPNPFNPSTTIKFALPKAGTVKVTVYDITGKEVQTLVNNFMNAGTHNIQFNASNIASGVYLYRIQADNFVKVNKMLLVK